MERKETNIPSNSTPSTGPSSVTLKYAETSISAIEERLKSLPKRDLFTLSDIDRSWNCVVETEDIRAGISKVSASVVAVALFCENNSLMDCSGFIIDWDATNSKGTILTTTRLLHFPEQCMSRENFNLVVRLKDGSLLPATEDYVDYYHNLMTLKVRCNKELKAVELEKECMTPGLHVISVGRHFFDCSTKVNEGGPLITTTGNIFGINFSYGKGFAYPLPTSVILKCLDKYRSNRLRLPMLPWVGMTLIDSNQLTYSAWEKLDLNPRESRAVVRKVYEQSPASRGGVRPGDTVTYFVDQKVASVKQFTEILGNISHKWKDRKSIMVVVEKLEDKKTVEFEVELVPVNDRRLCSYWPDDTKLWLRPYAELVGHNSPWRR